MRDKKVYNKRINMGFATWGNMMGAFKKPLKELLIKSERMSVYKKDFEKYINFKEEK